MCQSQTLNSTLTKQTKTCNQNYQDKGNWEICAECECKTDASLIEGEWSKTNDHLKDTTSLLRGDMNLSDSLFHPFKAGLETIN